MQATRAITADLLEDGTVLRLVLNQPKANVLTMSMMGEIVDALQAHASDRHLRFAFIRGGGGNFSFGASVEEHRRDQAAAMLRAFHQAVRVVAGFPVPVAALVEGRCLGGAFELALCCHFVFAPPGARFGCPEIKLGVFPPVFASIGALRMPGALAERLLLTGDDVDAAALERAGVVSVLDDPTIDAEAALIGWYRTHLGPRSAAALRHAVAASRRHSGLLAALAGPLNAAERQYVDDVVPSHDGNEGIEAFIARRAPVWEDA